MSSRARTQSVCVTICNSSARTPVCECVSVRVTICNSSIWLCECESVHMPGVCLVSSGLLACEWCVCGNESVCVGMCVCVCVCVCVCMRVRVRVCEYGNFSTRPEEPGI